MHRYAAGFTILEVLVVLMIAGVLLSVAIPQIGVIESRRAVVNARDALVFLAARARAGALETGDIVCITVDRANAHIEVTVEDGGAMIDQIDVGDQFDATISTSSGLDTEICYSSRGFALDALTNVSETENDTITFQRGAETARALARPLGQVEAL